MHSLADAVELGRLIGYALTEILTSRPLTAAEIVKQEETASLALLLEAVTDCRSLWDALRNPDTQVPSESSLIMVLCQLKELMRIGTLRRLWWCDTRDMCADGLNKGAVSRKALLLTTSTSEWNLSHEALSHRETMQHAVASAVDSILGSANEG